jgi:subtilisin family serine protease
MRIPWLLAMVVLLGLAAPLGAATPTADASSKVGAGVYDALGRSSKVRVLIAFQEAQPHGAADQRRADIKAKADALLAALPAGSHSVKRRFELVPALALEVDEHALQGLAHHPGVLRVDVDERGSGTLAEAKQLAHIMDVPAAAKSAGGGGKIAIVDSGIDLTHPDFQNRIVGQQCYCSNCWRRRLLSERHGEHVRTRQRAGRQRARHERGRDRGRRRRRSRCRAPRPTPRSWR